jgi:hypothetical protein
MIEENEQAILFLFVWGGIFGSKLCFGIQFKLMKGLEQVQLCVCVFLKVKSKKGK